MLLILLIKLFINVFKLIIIDNDSLKNSLIVII